MQNESIGLTKGRRQLIAIFVIFLLPPLLAWSAWQYLQSHGVSSTNNAGTLITPARPLAHEALEPVGGAGLDAMKGRWRYVMFANEACGVLCMDQLYLTRQTRFSTHKDMQRIRRLLVVSEALSLASAQKILDDHPDLIIARVMSTEQGSQWKKAFVGDEFSTQGKQFFLVDPLNNLMMYYDLTVEPKRLLKDLTKLLKVSQIG